MGKAARKKHAATPKGPRPAAYVRRPFAGLAGEADWVALTEILPAATATVALKAGVAPADGPAVVTIATPTAAPARRFAARRCLPSGSPVDDRLIRVSISRPHAPLRLRRWRARTTRVSTSTSTPTGTRTTARRVQPNRRRQTARAASLAKRAKKITITTQVDPTLVGGAYVRIGDRIVDRSVTTLLQTIANKLYDVSV